MIDWDETLVIVVAICGVLILGRLVQVYVLPWLG